MIKNHNKIESRLDLKIEFFSIDSPEINFNVIDCAKLYEKMNPIAFCEN